MSSAWPICAPGDGDGVGHGRLSHHNKRGKHVCVVQEFPILADQIGGVIDRELGCFARHV